MWLVFISFYFFRHFDVSIGVGNTKAMEIQETTSWFEDSVITATPMFQFTYIHPTIVRISIMGADLKREGILWTLNWNAGRLWAHKWILLDIWYSYVLLWSALVYNTWIFLDAYCHVKQQSAAMSYRMCWKWTHSLTLIAHLNASVRGRWILHAAKFIMFIGFCQKKEKVRTRGDF